MSSRKGLSLLHALESLATSPEQERSSFGAPRPHQLHERLIDVAMLVASLGASVVEVAQARVSALDRLARPERKGDGSD